MGLSSLNRTSQSSNHLSYQCHATTPVSNASIESVAFSGTPEEVKQKKKRKRQDLPPGKEDHTHVMSHYRPFIEFLDEASRCGVKETEPVKNSIVEKYDFVGKVNETLAESTDILNAIVTRITHVQASVHSMLLDVMEKDRQLVGAGKSVRLRQKKLRDDITKRQEKLVDSLELLSRNIGKIGAK